MSVVKHMRKPLAEISKFGGDPLMYRKFIRQFNTRIVCNTDDDDEKLTYLEQLTIGDANKIVSSFSHLDSAVGYNAALRELEERYGDNEMIASSYIKKAMMYPNLKANDSKGLDEFAVFLVECGNAVSSINSMRMLEYPDTLRKLVSKLPFHLHDRWRNTIQQSKERFESVSFHSLVSFVKREAIMANHPIFGRDVMANEIAVQGAKVHSQLHKATSSYTGVIAAREDETGQHKGTSVDQEGAIFDHKRVGTDESSHGSHTRPCPYCEDKFNT